MTVTVQKALWLNSPSWDFLLLWILNAHLQITQSHSSFPHFFAYICLLFSFQYLALHFNLHRIISFLIPPELLTSLREPEIQHSTWCSWEKTRDATVLAPFIFSFLHCPTVLFYLLFAARSLLSRRLGRWGYQGRDLMRCYAPPRTRGTRLEQSPQKMEDGFD